MVCSSGDDPPLAPFATSTNVAVMRVSLFKAASSASCFFCFASASACVGRQSQSEAHVGQAAVTFFSRSSRSSRRLSLFMRAISSFSSYQQLIIRLLQPGQRSSAEPNRVRERLVPRREQPHRGRPQQQPALHAAKAESASTFILPRGPVSRHASTSANGFILSRLLFFTRVFFCFNKSHASFLIKSHASFLIKSHASFLDTTCTSFFTLGSREKCCGRIQRRATLWRWLSPRAAAGPAGPASPPPGGTRSSNSRYFLCSIHGSRG